MAIKLKDFLKPELLGNKFVAIKNFSEVFDRDEPEKLVAYRIDISIQEESSPFFMELISVKVRNTNPTVTIKSLEGAKATPVTLEGLQLGEFNSNLWFACEDIKFAK